MTKPVLFRCHSLAELMAKPKSADEVLSVGAKTHIAKLVQETVFGIRKSVDSKYLRKGLDCENTAIALLNDYCGGNFTKNTERRENDWITGEPDIVTEWAGIDIKCSWSVATFPLTPEAGADKTYEWQCRGYMMLWDRPTWDVAYCLVDTPDELIGYEDYGLHKVSHIDPKLRVTVVTYHRDLEVEALIKTKLTAAQKHFAELLAEVCAKRGVVPVDPATVPVRPAKQTAAEAFLNV